MKRLTLRFDDGYILVLCSQCPIDMHDCNDKVCLDFVIRHLAAYEDTGLTPEEIEKLKHMANKTPTNGKHIDYVHYDFDTIEEATEE